MIKITYDKEGDLLEIKFSEEQVAHSDYLEDLGVVIDYNEKGNMLAIELLSFSKRVSKGDALETLVI